MSRFDGRQLPPMKTLQGFEAVARLLSFRQAAVELHLSHQAISNQIALLEDSLGQPLFIRSTRRIAMTEAGERLYPLVADMLYRLADRCEEIRKTGLSPVLRIHTYLTVALRWLAPMLPEFRKLYPDIEVQLISTIHQAAFDQQQADVGLVFKPDNLSSDLVWTPLMNPALYPVCSPALLASERLKGCEALLDYPLINISSERRQWLDWLCHFGIDTGISHPVTVDSTAVALEMALDGEGIVLIYDPVVDKELASGRLVRPVEQSISGIEPWGLICRHSDAGAEPVQCFIDWLKREMAQRCRSNSSGAVRGESGDQ